MGTCKFCGLKAGLFKSVHEECENSYQNGKSSIIETICNSLNTITDFSNLDNEVNAIASNSHVQKQEIDDLYSLGFDKAVDTFLDDGVISVDEEKRIVAFQNQMKLTQNILNKNGSLNKVVKSSILRDIMDGKIPESRLTINMDIPFIIQKDENIIWIFTDVELHELRTKTIYKGGSQGMSFKIAKGVYYRAGMFKGIPVKNDQMMLLGKGMLALTNSNLYFSSQSKSLKVPYKKLISLTPYSDGIGLQKDGASAKPQILKNIDGWFTYNLISNLNKL